ncbi:MAG: lipid II flippase MurJ [Propioniciclava sp.]|uniref:murein biosynthesis integral membrane protein MurJ n=1 Tax=Propioniciclava sp. TaxID=2038686 RepID=UPI0039E2A208
MPADDSARDEQDAASLGRASRLMASGSLVSRILGIVRNMLLIYCIGGTIGTASAFQTANTLPNALFILLSSGVLTAVLIPQITRALSAKGGGSGTVNALLTLCFGLITVVTVLATALGAPLVALFGLRDDVLVLGVAFAYLCMPQIFFYAAYAVWSQVLNVHGKFGLVMWTPALANVVQIAGMIVFLAVFPAQAPAEQWTPGMIWLLAGTSTLGIVVQAVALLPALRRTGVRFRPNFRFRGHGFRRAGQVAGLIMVAVIIAQLSGLVSQAAITHASETARTDAGQLVPNVNLYFLAFTIFMVPHGIVTVSILTALLPRMTRSSQAGDTAAVRRDVTQGITLPLLAMLPLTAAAVALALPGSRLLNPGLDDASVQAVAWSFSLMALGLVPFAIVGLQQRYATAREDGGTYLRFQLIVSGLQLVFAGLVVVLPPAVAVFTVSLGQSVSNTVAAAGFLWLVQRRLGGLPLRRLAGITLRLGAASALAGLVTYLVLRTAGAHLGSGLAASVLTLGIGTVTFGVVLWAGVHLFRVWELSWLLGSRAQRVLPAAPAGATSLF